MTRSTHLHAVLLGAMLLAACKAAEPPQPAHTPRANADAPAQVHDSSHGPLEVREWVLGLEHPWALAFLPDGAMLVTERPGRLRRIATDGSVSAPIRGLPEIYVSGQSGLLDVALSPGFAEDSLVYISYAEPNRRGNLSGTAAGRGRLQGDELLDFEVIYRQQPKLSAGTHAGSRLVFDGAGHLFVTQGDQRNAMDQVQSLDSLAGKIVRIRADGSIPADNPFTGTANARPEIHSLGHRNVQGAALHPQTGELWASEHGPMGGDELNIVRAGYNYGWPLVSDGMDYDGRPVPGSQGRTALGMTAPMHSWTPSPALSGMQFYRGDLFGQWRGNLFMGALAGQSLIRLELDGERVVGEERLLRERGERIRDVREGPDGALWLLVDAADGKLLRVTPAQAREP